MHMFLSSMHMCMHISIYTYRRKSSQKSVAVLCLAHLVSVQFLVDFRYQNLVDFGLVCCREGFGFSIYTQFPSFSGMLGGNGSRALKMHAYIYNAALHLHYYPIISFTIINCSFMSMHVSLQFQYMRNG